MADNLLRYILTIFPLENHRFFLHLYRMPGPKGDLDAIFPMLRIEIHSLDLLKAAIRLLVIEDDIKAAFDTDIRLRRILMPMNRWSSECSMSLLIYCRVAKEVDNCQ